MKFDLSKRLLDQAVIKMALEPNRAIEKQTEFEDTELAESAIRESSFPGESSLTLLRTPAFEATASMKGPDRSPSKFAASNASDRVLSAAREFLIHRSPDCLAAFAEAVNIQGHPIDQLTKAALTQIEPLFSTLQSEFGIPAWLWVFEHKDFGGRAMLTVLNDPFRYYYFRKPYLDIFGLHDKISSLKHTPFGVLSEAVLFEHDNFEGRFRRFINDDRVQTLEVPYVGDDWNDIVSSGFLVVRDDPNAIELSIRQELTKMGAFDRIRDYLTDDRTSLRNDIVVTWDMWPQGGSDHPNDFNTFIRIDVPISIDATFTYNATISYWILPVITAEGMLGASVAYWRWKVSGNVLLLGTVSLTLDAAVSDSVSEVNALLAEATAGINRGLTFFQWTLWTTYLLPGENGAENGHVTDGVTLVLVPNL